MNKLAKTPPDPARAKLLENKSNWKKKVNPFMKGLYQTRKAIPPLLDDLKNLKKLMGGYPGKYHQQKGDIKSPIPGNPVDILSEISKQYYHISKYLQDQQEVLNNIVQEGKSVVSEQDTYSKSFKDKKASQADELLFSEGSNVLSRFWTRMTTFPMGRVQEEFRVEGLKRLPKIYRKMVKVYNIMNVGMIGSLFGGPGNSKINRAKELYDDAYSDFISLKKTFDRDIYDPFAQSEKEKQLLSGQVITDVEEMNKKISEIDEKFRKDYNDGKLPKIEESATISNFFQKLQNFKILRSPTSILKDGNDIILDWSKINPDTVPTQSQQSTPPTSPTSQPTTSPTPQPTASPTPEPQSVNTNSNNPTPTSTPVNLNPVINPGANVNILPQPTELVSIQHSRINSMIKLADRFEAQLTSLADVSTAKSIANKSKITLNQIDSLMDLLEEGMNIVTINRLFTDLTENFKKIGSDLSRIATSSSDSDKTTKQLERSKQLDRIKEHKALYAPKDESRVGLY